MFQAAEGEHMYSKMNISKGDHPDMNVSAFFHKGKPHAVFSLRFQNEDPMDSLMWS